MEGTKISFITDESLMGLILMLIYVRNFNRGYE